MQFEQICGICDKFNLDAKVTDVVSFGNGNINLTFLVSFDKGFRCVLQRVNTNVFKNPDELMQNVTGVTEFVAKKLAERGEDVTRGTLSFFSIKDGKKYYLDQEGYAWRMYKCIEDATAYDSAEKAGLLYEAAYAFGRFQQLLGEYPADTLYETIPNFHNTPVRYKAFEEALANDAAKRVDGVKSEIEILRKYASRASIVTDALASKEIPMRVTHNDTKLNNVLIDNETGKGICVIDLDTVMPGSLLYDFGDSVRFAANNGAEDAEDLSEIWLNLDRFEEYAKGFLYGVGDAITEKEKEMLPISVFLLTYELALRFMTDYLNGDTYFKIKYPEHNIVRTRAQIKLCEDIDTKLDKMGDIIRSL